MSCRGTVASGSLGVVMIVALWSGVSNANAAPSARSYSPVNCKVSSQQDLDATWSVNHEGFRGIPRGEPGDGIRFLNVQCPIVKDNVGEDIRRAFVWVSNLSSTNRLLCSLQSRRVSAGTGTFFSNKSAGIVSASRRLDFSVDSVPDSSLVESGPIDEPAVYNLQCQVPAGGRVRGYHIDTEG